MLRLMPLVIIVYHSTGRTILYLQPINKLTSQCEIRTTLRTEHVLFTCSCMYFVPLLDHPLVIGNGKPQYIKIQFIKVLTCIIETCFSLLPSPDLQCNYDANSFNNWLMRDCPNILWIAFTQYLRSFTVKSVEIWTE